MSNSARAKARPRRARPATWRTTAAMIAKVSAQQLGVSNSRLQATTDSEGRPGFDLSAHGFSRQQAHSRQIRVKLNECEHGMPTGLPEG